jgi:hypothetical protein
MKIFFVKSDKDTIEKDDVVYIDDDYPHFSIEKQDLGKTEDYPITHIYDIIVVDFDENIECNDYYYDSESNKIRQWKSFYMLPCGYEDIYHKILYSSNPKFELPILSKEAINLIVEREFFNDLEDPIFTVNENLLEVSFPDKIYTENDMKNEIKTFLKWMSNEKDFNINDSDINEVIEDYNYYKRNKD